MVEKVLVDVNNAEEGELTLIPGIGPALAERIIQGRPFNGYEDFTRVSGINTVMLERIKPYISIAPTPPEVDDVAGFESIATGMDDEFDEDDFKPEEVFNLLRGDVVVPPLPEHHEQAVEDELPLLIPEKVKEIASPLMDEAVDETVKSNAPDTPLSAEEPIVDMSQEEQAPEAEHPFIPSAQTDNAEKPVTNVLVTDANYVTRGQFLWIGLLIMVLAVILGMALSLGILTGVNGGLRYAAPEQVTALSRELTTLSNRAGAMATTLEGVQTRLDNLEALSGRIESLESLTGDLQSDVGNLNSDVDAINMSIATLNDQAEALRSEMDIVNEQTSRFQDVMDGLRDLLNSLFPTESGK